MVNLRQNLDLIYDLIKVGLGYHMLKDDFDASLARRWIMIALSNLVMLACCQEISQTIVKSHLPCILQLSFVLNILLIRAILLRF